MSKVFANDEHAKYSAGNVKAYERCVIKGTTDYVDRAFPSISNIIDFLRFSVTYPSMETMIAGINRFVDMINNNEIECLVGIARVKNGFNNVSAWKSYQNAQYVDLKLNVIYQNKDKTQCMIVECQFLQSFLLKAKKIGHKVKCAVYIYK